MGRSADGWVLLWGALLDVHPPKPLGPLPPTAFRKSKAPCSQQSVKAHPHILFLGFSQNRFASFPGKPHPRHIKRVKAISSRYRAEEPNPYPTMASPENVDSGGPIRPLWRVTGETFSRTYSIVKPIHSLLNQNNACALERGNNIIR